MRRPSRHRICAGLAGSPLFLALAFAGCAPTYTTSIRLALDGPPLTVAAQGETSSWDGSMDRGCMAGFGAVFLRNAANGVDCTGTVDRPATDKGRLYAELDCTNSGAMTMVFRNLGPDQGMGLARLTINGEGGEQLTLFYHPSPEEARRRLGQIRAEITEALKKEKKKPATSREQTDMP